MDLMAYLEEAAEHVEGVDGAGAVRVAHQLVEVGAPGLLGVVARRWLECRQDGGEEGRGWRRRARARARAHRDVISLLLCEADGQRRVQLACLASASDKSLIFVVCSIAYVLCSTTVVQRGSRVIKILENTFYAPPQYVTSLLGREPGGRTCASSCGGPDFCREWAEPPECRRSETREGGSLRRATCPPRLCLHLLVKTVRKQETCFFSTYICTQQCSRQQNGNTVNPRQCALCECTYFR